MLCERSQLVQLLSRMNMSVVQTSHRKNTSYKSYPTYSHSTVLLSCVFPGSVRPHQWLSGICWDPSGLNWATPMGMAMGRVCFHSYCYHILEHIGDILDNRDYQRSQFWPLSISSSSLALMPLMYRWFPEWEIRLYHFPNSLVISARLCCRSPSPPAPPATTGTGRFWGTNLRSSWVKAKTLRILRNCPECLRLWKTAKHLV